MKKAQKTDVWYPSKDWVSNETKKTPSREEGIKNQRGNFMDTLAWRGEDLPAQVIKENGGTTDTNLEYLIHPQGEVVQPTANLSPKGTETAYTPPTPNYDPTNGVPSYLPKGLNPILWERYKPDAFRDNAEEPKTDTGLTTSDPWNQRMDELYAQLANLEPPRIGDFKGPTFNYDYRDDPSYQQYRQQYVRNGQLAMQDTMGQAAGLTGGYGSSYSQNVGQQAYQGYMNQLNAVVPELYQNAYNRYLNDYSNQYNEWRDKYSADLDAYKAQLNNIGTQYDFINNERAYENAQNATPTTDYESLAKYYNSIAALSKAGIGVDENGNLYELPTEAEQSGTEAQNATPSTTSNVPAEERKYTGKIGSILNSDIRMGKDAGGNFFTYTASKPQTTQDGKRKAEVIDREIDEVKQMPGYPTMGSKEQQAQFIVTALRQQGYSDLEISYVLETLDEE